MYEHTSTPDDSFRACSIHIKFHEALTTFATLKKLLSVSSGIRERRGGEPDTAVRDVEDVVEPLQERHAVDEVQAFAAEAAEVVHDQVDKVGRAADQRVELLVRPVSFCRARRYKTRV